MRSTVTGTSKFVVFGRFENLIEVTHRPDDSASLNSIAYSIGRGLTSTLHARLTCRSKSNDDAITNSTVPTGIGSIDGVLMDTGVNFSVTTIAVPDSLKSVCRRRRNSTCPLTQDGCLYSQLRLRTQSGHGLQRPPAAIQRVPTRVRISQVCQCSHILVRHCVVKTPQLLTKPSLFVNVWIVSSELSSDQEHFWQHLRSSSDCLKERIIVACVSPIRELRISIFDKLIKFFHFHRTSRGRADDCVHGSRSAVLCEPPRIACTYYERI